MIQIKAFVHPLSCSKPRGFSATFQFKFQISGSQPDFRCARARPCVFPARLQHHSVVVVLTLSPGRNRAGPTCSAPWKQILQLGVGMHVSLLLLEGAACGLQTRPPAAPSSPPPSPPLLVSPQLGPSSPDCGRPWEPSSQVWRRPAAGAASVLMVK